MLIAGLVSLTLAAGPVVPVASGAPHFDIERSCRHVGDPQTGIGRSTSSCADDERQAQAALDRRWASFPATDRTTCVEGARLGGPPSYVQVLTCLEMAGPK